MNTNGMKKIDVMTESDIPLIRKLFKSDIENFLEISHFSIIAITPKKEAFIISTSKNFSNSYCEHGFHKYDNTMCPLMYQNLDFYTWAEGRVNFRQKEIAHIKKVYGLNNGAVFVRRLNSLTLLYCVATKKEDPIMKSIFVNKANDILQLGDYCYNELATGFEEVLSGDVLPKIEVFKPFLDKEIPCFTSYETYQRKEIVNIIEAGDAKLCKSKLRLAVNNKTR